MTRDRYTNTIDGLPFYMPPGSELSEGLDITLSTPELPTDPLWCRHCDATSPRAQWR